jgi:predicted nucleotide-binding protein (sugar kinase/HSP70/actin superfamily)
MFEDWRDELGLTRDEASRATAEGLRVYSEFLNEMRRRSRETLDSLAANDQIGVVILGRPYHNDPGINHEICEELQKLGYSIFWQDALPIDEDILEELFGQEVREGAFKSPLSIDDVWKNSYSENTSRKVWAAKFAARHPNLVALELSNFKCGHDAPIYSIIEEIIERSGTPYFCFKDIDENKPTGAIKIRIETIAYFLKRYRERLVAQKQKLADIESQVARFEHRLRNEQASRSLLEPNLVTV